MPGNSSAPPDLNAVQATSFVAWMINDQRDRRDIVGALAANFARDPVIRSEYLDADYSCLKSYLEHRDASAGALLALKNAHTEWRDIYGWYNWPE